MRNRLKIEREIHEGKKRVDIVATNPGRVNRFFSALQHSHHIHCPWVFIECKNYKQEIANPELDQLAGRLDRTKGKFGMLIFRQSENRQELLKSCRHYLRDDKYILPLDDHDMIHLLELRQANALDDIATFLDDRFQELVL